MKSIIPKPFWQFDSNCWFQKLNSSEKGLSQKTDDDILLKSGISRKGKSALQKDFVLFIGQFRSPLMLLLIGSVILSAFLGGTSDVFIILFIVLSTGLLANTLLSVTDHCLRSHNYINVIVAGKQPELQYLDMDAAIKHCTAGLGIWEWASNDKGQDPDVVMACCGDVPTLETLADVEILREHFPQLKIGVINVMDLMSLQPQSEHPHGLNDKDFDDLFTRDKPIIFAFHGYPLLIHRLTYRRTNHSQLHVRGYKGHGTTTTPFDMVVLNDLDRFHLVSDVIERVPELGSRAAYTKQYIRDKLIDHRAYICKHGEDMPEIKNWKWKK